MIRRLGRWAPLWAALVTFAVVAAVVGATLRLRTDRDSATSASGPAGTLVAQVVQLRRDEALGRVEIGVTNHGTAPVVVTRLRLRAGGFTGGGWVQKDEPIPAGQLVNLPTPYGEPRCPATGGPVLGHIRVDLALAATDRAAPGVVHPTASASRSLLTRVLTSLCTAQRLRREVALSFGTPWSGKGSGDTLALFTTIEARLAAGAGPQDITQVGGNVLYELRPVGAAAPLARLDAAHPAASLPVVLTQARCTGHAKGEIKKPYLFLVWLGPRAPPGRPSSWLSARPTRPVCGRCVRSERGGGRALTCSIAIFT